jgi:hypothetical protein
MEGRVCATLIGAVFVVGCSRSGGKTEIVRAAPAFVAPISESRPTGCRAPLGLDVVPIGESRSGSTVVLARTHGRLLAYVADEDASVVRILDVEAATELGSVPMPGHPGRMLMLRGGRLAVTLRDAAKVAGSTLSAHSIHRTSLSTWPRHRTATRSWPSVTGAILSLPSTSTRARRSTPSTCRGPRARSSSRRTAHTRTSLTRRAAR